MCNGSIINEFDGVGSGRDKIVEDECDGHITESNFEKKKIEF